MTERGRCFSMGYATLSGPVAVDDERFVAAAINLRGRRESRWTNETPQGMWLGGARKGSLWLCNAGPLAGRQKSGISGNRRRPKPTP